MAYPQGHSKSTAPHQISSRTDNLYANLSPAALTEMAIARREGRNGRRPKPS